jgi:hypothetical protein
MHENMIVQQLTLTYTLQINVFSIHPHLRSDFKKWDKQSLLTPIFASFSLLHEDKQYPILGFIDSSQYCWKGDANLCQSLA